MRVTVRYFGIVSLETKKLMEDLILPEKTTLNELITLLSQRYGYKFENKCFIRPLYSDKDYFNISINTQDLNDKKIFEHGLETVLKEDDIISFGPIGGAA